MLNDHLKKIRSLTLWLLASGAMNILLLAALFFWLFVERPPTPVCESLPVTQVRAKAIKEASSEQLLASFKTLSLEQLLPKLSKDKHIENGYTERDLALGALVTYHFFDLERALHGKPVQTRILTFGQPEEQIKVFPGLTSEHFETIKVFAKTETWPVTTHGLFQLLHREDPSLFEAFTSSPEFLSVELLFRRGAHPVEKQTLLKLLREGQWGQIQSFYEKQKIVQDLSSEARLKFLSEYLKKESATAAQLFIEADLEYAGKKLDDSSVLSLLKHLNEKTPASEKFALQLLASPRSDLVREAAAAKLYEYAGEPKPPFDYQAAMRRFILPKGAPLKIVAEEVVKPKPKPVTPPTPFKKPRVHIVQEGDSLWKIGRKYKVDTQVLKDYNGLKTDALKPGTPLKIPG